MHDRERLLTSPFASNLVGVTSGTWLRLLLENRFRIDPRFWPRAAVVTAASLLNSACRVLDDLRVGTRGVEVPPPLFIVGHWRSGTTHLHNLMTADRRFAAPNLAQVLFPQSFLTLGRPLERLLRRVLPATRLIDEMALDADLPQEDEFALCSLTGASPYVAYAFPRNWHRYDRYLTLEGVSADELRRWESALRGYVRKLSSVLRGTLVLKSPLHTARLRHLLRVFPEARFVHVHRDPYRVFLSTRHMLSIGPRMAQLQVFDFTRLEEIILDRYEAMYDAFLEQRGQIPAGRLCEISFAALERDPIGALQEIYRSLDLPSFASAEAEVRCYASSVAAYRRNRYDPPPQPLAERVAGRWRRFFEVWGYPVEITGSCDKADTS